MKLAKPTEAEAKALLNLMRVLNTAEDGIPCKPDGTWEDGEEDSLSGFDPDDTEHLRKFYERVTACFEKHPGGLLRTVGAFHLAWTNGVFAPDADTCEWHPDLQPAVKAREAREKGVPCHGWHTQASQPPEEAGVPVLVHGILEGETAPDWHEGFWSGRSWMSARSQEVPLDDEPGHDLRHLKITALFWQPMPPNPTPTTP